MNILQEKKFPSIQKTVMQQAKFMYYSLWKLLDKPTKPIEDLKKKKTNKSNRRLRRTIDSILTEITKYL